MGGWAAAWAVLNEGYPTQAFPEELISFVVNTVNANHLEIIGVMVSSGGKITTLGEGDPTGAELIASSVQNGMTVNIWKVPSPPSIYDDPGVQAIMRQFSYPGASAIDEAYAIYLYLYGLPDDGMDAFIGWVERRVGGRQPYQP
jgi:hypothetical protein